MVIKKKTTPKINHFSDAKTNKNLADNRGITCAVVRTAPSLCYGLRNGRLLCFSIFIALHHHLTVTIMLISQSTLTSSLWALWYPLV